MNSSTGLPLEGLTVVDWTHVLSGPFASYNLVLLGARVIRIERTDSADMVRLKSANADRTAHEMGDGYVMMAGGKESIALDAKDSEAAKVLEKLISRADVLVENFRPGTLVELGFDPARLIERFPQLIVCSISGFGQQGPWSRRPAYDHIVQAVSGMMAVNADTRGTPQRIGAPLVDYATGMHAAMAILAAIHRRSRDNKSKTRERGEWIDISMRQTALTLLAPAYSSYAASGIERQASRATAFSGNPLSGTFRSADGHIAVVCNTARQSTSFMEALSNLGVVDHEIQLLERAAKASDVNTLHDHLDRIFAPFSAEHLEQIFVKFDVPAATVLSPSAVYREARGDSRHWPSVGVLGGSGKAVSVPGIGYLSSRDSASMLTSPPLRGEQTWSLMRELGFDDATISRMCAAGTLSSRTRSPSEETP